MKRLLLSIALVLIPILVCFAQNWSSEAEINNYYNSRINQKRDELAVYQRQMQYLDRDEYGIAIHLDEEKKLRNAILSLKVEIAQLDYERNSQLANFRQAEERRRQIERQKKEDEERKKLADKRQKEKQEQERKAAIKAQKNREREEENRRIAEERRREKEKEAEIKAEERKRQKELEFQQELARQKAIKAPELISDFTRYDQTKRNVEEAKHTKFSYIMEKHSRSGFVPYSDGGKTIKVGVHNTNDALANKYLRNRGQATNTAQSHSWLEEFDY